MYQEFLDVWLEAIQWAKAITMKYYGKNEEMITLGEKETVDRNNKHFNNPATVADEEAEAYIKSYIKEYFPDHNFLGEEEGKENVWSSYTWIIDPIDGTKAYARWIDEWAILLALQKDKEIVLWISCMPVIDELIWATKWGGCFCNDKICCVSNRIMSDAFLSHERYKYFQREWLVDQLESVRSCVKYYLWAKTPRWFHYLVQWKVEMILGPTNMYLYDIAPYIVMVSEAWGKFTTLTWEDVVDERTSFLASNGVFHDEVVSLFSS